MTEIADKWFNGENLGYHGLVTPDVSGLFDVPDLEVARSWTDGCDIPNDVTIRHGLPTIQFTDAVVAEDTHEELVRKLALLAGLIAPDLGFCTFEIENRPGQRTWARSKGLPVRIDVLPYIARSVIFTLAFERWSWWEDAYPITLTDPTSINNTGQMSAYPTYTMTVTNTLSSGLSLTVGSRTWQYTGALTATDVLVLATDPQAPDITLNGTRDFANADSDDRLTLAVGKNTVTKSSADYTLDVSYRRRYF